MSMNRENSITEMLSGMKFKEFQESDDEEVDDFQGEVKKQIDDFDQPNQGADHA